MNLIRSNWVGEHNADNYEYGGHKAYKYGGHPAPAGRALSNLINAVRMLKSKSKDNTLYVWVRRCF